jgi:23S rRNA (cytidine2498-2'-O)-methyltransferase
MKSLSSPYLFAICQAGAEVALKGEVAREHPAFKLAFSRPGFVTFKAPAPLSPDLVLRSVFARAYGLSLGQLGTADSPDDLIACAQASLPEGGRPFALHVFEREGPQPEERTRNAAGPRLALRVAERLRAALPGFWADSETPEPAQGVADVLVLEPDTGQSSPLFLGFHGHGPGHSPWPGGRPEIALPAEAPSRAFLKLEEALRVIAAPVRAGDVALEVGCAPGGAAFALLKRGVQVYGVDAAACAPIVRDSPRFVALRKSIGSIRLAELPARVHWLLFDVNAGAFRSVPAADKLVRHYRQSLLGLVLTLKLARWDKADDIPGIVAEVGRWGFAQIRAVQLYHNRQEVVILALTASAAERSG